MRTNYSSDFVDTPDNPFRCGDGEWCRPADVRNAVRRAVVGRCGATGCPYDEEGLSDALLVASELSTNAILHGGGMTGFDVDVDGRAVRVSVSDRSDRLPVAVDPYDERGRGRAGGRGWPIVCRLARDVRVADLPSGGKRITAVVPVFRPAGRPSGGTAADIP
ncbi:anti-sigma regulatory factor (Ser/Thr protein kinase) [Streptomyces sp. B4I13]|uniref:Anti-sigma regulatory factor (Ser/Thr protein kinase) n=1 Tax=Streptomyces achromogenes TaxID=67255 RepID=A0ABU0PTD7_STRAH|nr:MULTISPECIES: ATP-binding protein [Streptomyces]MDQ0681629.1 anti-sigma regulatory factor (Ser/Thr protein kinase) [Streptomyces achromogenes]MDQ0828783.1 anti-sigma regulatory factor (Ser/Thr protein kinase) [Streptomyces achromogenes]MDQ0964037.1 anti-sigma regulatory factor (Ser/Thr protein kinase) [Streptomyces sp. B4I13]